MRILAVLYDLILQDLANLTADSERITRIYHKMEEEEGTIIIEVNNADWPVKEEGGYQQYQVADWASLNYDEVEGAKKDQVGIVHNEVEGSEASYTQILCDGKEMNSQMVTYEYIPAKGEMHECVVQSSDVTKSVVQNSDTYTDQAENGEGVQISGCEECREVTEHPSEFTCFYCPMKYSNKSLLKAHLWVHPQHEPFKCQVCNSTFRNKVEVDEHAKQHFYNKNFFCRLCGASLSCKASCINHIRKTHGGDDSNIDMFMLKEVTNSGKMVLVIRTVRNGKVYKRKFAMMKQQ